MQLEKAERKNYNAHFAGHGAPSRFTQRIGSTIYTVDIHHGISKSETLEDKILRMIKNDLKIVQNNAIIGVPQAEWLPERGSL